MTDIRAKPQIPQHFHPDLAQSISIDVESSSSGSGASSPSGTVATVPLHSPAQNTTTGRRSSFSPNWNLYKVGSETRVAIRKISAPLTFQYGAGKPPSPQPPGSGQQRSAYRSVPSPGAAISYGNNGEYP